MLDYCVVPGLPSIDYVVVLFRIGDPADILNNARTCMIGYLYLHSTQIDILIFRLGKDEEW